MKVSDVYISKEEIDRRVAELGRQISKEYAGKSLLAVGILKGAAVFTADLIRHIEADVQLDFMAVSSYGMSTKTTGAVQIIKDLSTDISGQHVLLIEDIIDTGLTLHYLLELMEAREPASVKICTLLDKPYSRERHVEPDYVGFSVKDEFIVGYGIDYQEKYRHLPHIAYMRQDNEAK